MRTRSDLSVSSPDRRSILLSYRLSTINARKCMSESIRTIRLCCSETNWTFSRPLSDGTQGKPQLCPPQKKRKSIIIWLITLITIKFTELNILLGPYQTSQWLTCFNVLNFVYHTSILCSRKCMNYVVNETLALHINRSWLVLTVSTNFQSIPTISEFRNTNSDPNRWTSLIHLISLLLLKLPGFL